MLNLVILPKATAKQVEAGNYKKHHLRMHGLDISIENPKGTERSGTDKHGHKWHTKMTAHYGYIRGTNGNDDEHIDVFIGPDLESEKVFVINQLDADTGRFDEHKAILGVQGLDDARRLYLSHYEKGWQGLGSIKEKSVDEFKAWLKDGDTQAAIKAIRDLPLLPSRKNPQVRRHQRMQQTQAEMARDKFHADTTGTAIRTLETSKTLGELGFSHAGPADMELTLKDNSYFTFNKEPPTDEVINEALKPYKTNIKEIAWACNLQHEKFYTSNLTIEDEGGGVFTATGIIRRHDNEAAAGMFQFYFEYPAKNLLIGSFFLRDNYQGEGIAGALLEDVFAYVQKKKFQVATLTADGVVGKYAWALYGFDFEKDKDREQWLEGFQSYVRFYLRSQPRFSDSQIEAINDAAESLTYSWDIARFRIGGHKIGKEYLLKQGDWEGRLYFDRSEDHLRVFDATLEAQRQKAQKAMVNKDSEAFHRELIENEDKIMDKLDELFGSLNFDYGDEKTEKAVVRVPPHVRAGKPVAGYTREQLLAKMPWYTQPPGARRGQPSLNPNDHFEQKIIDILKAGPSMRNYVGSEDGVRKFLNDKQKHFAAHGLEVSIQKLWSIGLNDRCRTVWGEAECLARVVKPTEQKGEMYELWAKAKEARSLEAQYKKQYAGKRKGRFGGFGNIFKSLSPWQFVVLPRMLKDIIPTPHIPGGTKIDWGAVPVGASIWITVTDEGSPLAGRHILITKRSDNQAVIDPGEARRQGYNVGSWQEEAFGGPEGMAHASFQFGKLHEQEKDKEKWQEYKTRQAERAPFVEKIKEVRKEARAKVKDLEEKFIQSVGISKIGLTQTEKKAVSSAAVLQAKQAGLEGELAQAYGDHVARMQDQLTRRFQRENALRRLNYYQHQLEKILEPPEEKKEAPEAKEHPATYDEAPSEQPVTQTETDAFEQVLARDSQPLEIEAPEVPLTATTVEEVQHAVGEDMIKKAAQAKKRREENLELREEAKHDAIIIKAAEETEEMFTQDQEAAKQAVEDFQNFQRAVAEQKEIKKIMPPKIPRPETAVVAQAIESMRLKAVEAVDDEAMKAAEHNYRKSAEMNLDQGFYSTIAEHWNEETGYMLNGGEQKGATDYLNGMLKRKKGFVSGAAAAALTGLVGKHTDVELDIGRLANALSPAVAATIVGYWLVDQARQRQLGKKTITGIIDSIERDNMGMDEEGKRDPEKGLLAMEHKALAKDRELKETYEKIKYDKNHGLLTAEGTIMRREAENILQRRENLGNAYGSLSASGQLLLAMKHAQADINERIAINVGSSRDNAIAVLETLGIKETRIPPEVKILPSLMGSDEAGEPLTQYQLSGSALYFARRWGQSAPIMNTEAKELEKIKTSNAPVTPADVPPFFRKEWVNDAGEKGPFMPRQPQRNDINYLIREGGGLITRSTGTGKTLTSLGYIGHRLKENPHSKHLVIVPEGTTEQWLDQGTRATEMNFVVIPEKQTKEARAKLWASIKPGQVVIVSHSDALKAQTDVDAITGAGFDTCVIDEPQKLKSQASARMGTAARRIIGIPFKHRIGLSATPARESLDEIYDWVNWSTKEHIGEDKRGRPMYRPKIGSRAGFGRMYSGMGTGTNAQDESVQNLIYRKLGPYVSGDQFKERLNYKVEHHDYSAKRTKEQLEKQRQIEAGYDQMKTKIETEERDKLKRAGKPMFQLKQKVAHRLMKEMDKKHWDNLHGGDKNGKTESISKNFADITKEGRTEHIVFVDTPLQMGSIQRTLAKQGVKSFYDISELNKRVKFKEEAEKIATAEGITPDQAIARVVQQRIKQWGEHRGKKEPAVMFIDRTSQAGFNLQKGTDLHIAGKPEDASALYQIIGRGDRGPREGDLHVHTYRYSDSAFEDIGWQNDIEARKKITLSITPALAKAVDNPVYIGVLFERLAKAIISSRILSLFGWNQAKTY